MRGADPTPEREEPIAITPAMLTGAGVRVDFERGMRAAPPFVLFLIAVNVAMYGWEVASGALADGETITEAGALVRERVLAGEIWRLASAMFLHGGPDHLVGNAIALYIVGMACEHAFGFARTAVVYFGSGVAGSLLSLATGPGPSVGASGAIFGVLGAVVAVLYRHRDRFHVRDKRVAAVLAAWAGYQVLTGLLTPFIDNMAHIGGFLGGALAGAALRPRLLSESARG